METTNFKKRDAGPAFVWTILGIVVTVASLQLGLGALRKPGPGMMPFLLGLVLIFLSLPLLLSSLKRILNEKTKEGNPWKGINYGRMSLAVLALVIYGLLIEYVGFTVSVFVTIFFLYRLVSAKKTLWVLVFACGTAAFCYLVFVIALRVEFPSFPRHLFF